MNDEVSEQPVIVKDESRSKSRFGRVAVIGAAVVAVGAVIAIPAGAVIVSANAEDAAADHPVREAAAVDTAAPSPTTSAGAVGAGLLGASSIPGSPAPAAAPATPPTTGATPPAAVPTPAATPAPAATKVVSQRELLKLVKKNFPADQLGNAMAVAQCESGQRSIVGATNSDGTTDWGVFQLNDGGTLQGSLRTIGVTFGDTRAAQVAALNPVTNVKAAGAIYRDRGWAPWVCAYKQQIVASLYSNEKGPMYGRYNAVGGAKGSLNPSQSDLDKTKQKQKEKEKAKEAAKQKEKEKQKQKEQDAAKGKNPPASTPSPDPTDSPGPSESEPDSAQSPAQ